jgi:AraC-like DNA-binding protein
VRCSAAVYDRPAARKIAEYDNNLVIWRHNNAMKDSVAALPTPATYTRILLQRWPERATALLLGTGLKATALPVMATISAAQQLTIFANAMRLAARAQWALDFGRQLNISSHGPLGFAALSAPTLGDGLEVFGRFARIRAPYLGFELRHDEARLRLTIDTRLCELGMLELPLIEIILQVAASYIDAVVGPDAIDTTLFIAHPPPAHAPLYGEYFTSPVVFDADFHGIALPASLKALPCPLRDDKTYRAALARCREALDAVLKPDDVVARASHWLAAHFDQIAARGAAAAQPRLEDLAAALNLSPRTVIRQLGKHGRSFSDLRTAQQREIACAMLAEARYTVSEISALLGYGDAANFGRAFRRMTGVSPGQYRRGQRRSGMSGDRAATAHPGGKAA